MVPYPLSPLLSAAGGVEVVTITVSTWYNNLY